MARRKIVISRMPVGTQQKIRRHLQPGELTKHGYSMSDPTEKRRLALRKSIKEDGARRVAKRLLLLRVWNKNDNPNLASIAEKDYLWVKNQYKTNGYVS